MGKENRMNKIPLSELGRNLSSIIRGVEEDLKPLVVTVNGRPAAMLGPFQREAINNQGCFCQEHSPTEFTDGSCSISEAQELANHIGKLAKSEMFREIGEVMLAIGRPNITISLNPGQGQMDPCDLAQVVLNALLDNLKEGFEQGRDMIDENDQGEPDWESVEAEKEMTALLCPKEPEIY